MMMERVAPRPVNHPDVGIGDLAPIDVDCFTGVHQAIKDARGRYRRRQGLRRRTGPETGHFATLGLWRTARSVVIGGAEATSWLSNLTKHRRQRRDHPVHLLTVLL